MTFIWTKEAEAQLVELIKAGWSSQQIADKLGAPSRNAILGKANRLGISVGKARNTNVWTPERLQILIEMAQANEGSAAIADAVNRLPGFYITPASVRARAAVMSLKIGGGQSEQRAKWRGAANTNPRAKMPESEVDDEPAPEGGVSLLDIGHGQCRWPLGNPRDVEGFRFCGAGISAGSYCRSHAALAYIRAERRTPAEVQRARADAARKTREILGWM